MLFRSDFQPRMAAQGMRMTYQGITFMNETAVWPAKTVSISTTAASLGTWASPGFSTPRNTPVSGKFEFSATTAEGDNVVIKKCSEPSQGTVTLAANGSWTYTPAPGFAGKDSFTVGFQVDGYGIPMGPAASSNRGTTAWNGFRSVYINVTETGTIESTITTLASRPTNIRVQFDPPVPNLINTNFSIDNGVTIRMAETFDNGSTYLLVTTPRTDGNATYTLTVSKNSTAPSYTFNTVEIYDNPINPKPVSFEVVQASFIIKDITKIIAEGDAVAAANALAGTMRASTGYAIPVTDGTAGIRDITMAIIPETQDLATDVTYAIAGDNAYALEIGVDGVFLTAYAPEGLLRGVEAIKQLLPNEITSTTLVTGIDWVMTYASIYDFPVTYAELSELLARFADMQMKDYELATWRVAFEASLVAQAIEENPSDYTAVQVNQACSDLRNALENLEAVEALIVELAPGQLSTIALKVGATGQISVIANTPVLYMSSAVSTVSVTQKGEIKGLKAGIAVITIRSLLDPSIIISVVVNCTK